MNENGVELLEGCVERRALALAAPRGKAAGFKDVVSLPPTLDHAVRDIPASSAARLAGVAEPRTKLSRRFAAERAMRTNVVTRLAFTRQPSRRSST
ncbi:MAG: hypothetical protein ABSF67_21000 [Roseiarcus sp.]